MLLRHSIFLSQFKGKNCMLQNTLHKQTGRFIGAIATNLPKISTDVMQSWIENPTALQKVLKEALCPPQKEVTPTAPKELRKFGITIGGKSSEILMAEIEDKFSLGDYAKSMMKHKSFTTLPKEEAIELVIITPRDLGFESLPTFRTFLDTIKKHPKYELCSGEEAAHLRLAYPNQPEGEGIYVVMETISDSDDFPCVFSVVHEDDYLLLDSSWKDPAHTPHLDALWAVRLRK